MVTAEGIYNSLVGLHNHIRGAFIGYYDGLEVDVAKHSKPKRIEPLKSEKALAKAVQEGRLSDVVLNLEVDISNPHSQAATTRYTANYSGCYDGEHFELTTHVMAHAGASDFDIEHRNDRYNSHQKNHLRELFDKQLALLLSFHDSRTPINITLDGVPLRVDRSPLRV